MTQLHLGRQRLDRDRVLSLDHFVCVFDTCTTLLFANFNKSAYAVLKICWALALSIIYPSASVCKTQSVHPYMIVSLSNCHHSRTAHSNHGHFSFSLTLDYATIRYHSHQCHHGIRQTFCTQMTNADVFLLVQ